MHSLKRLVWEGGTQFRYDQATEPQQPKPGEVLVRPTAVGICGTDIHAIEGRFSVARPPLVLGHEIAGVVVETGAGVDRVKVGDRVTIDQVVGCGECFYCQRGSRQFCKSGYELGLTADGGCQSFLVVPQRSAFAIPANISDEAAAILDMEVWAALSKCGVNPGESVLVIGPGSAGMVACQVARILGAGRVILAGPDSDRMKKAQELGLADAYIFTDRESVSDRSMAETSGHGVHVSIDCAGASDAFTAALTSVMAGGRVVLYGLHTRPLQSFEVNDIVLRDLVLFGALSDRRGWEDVIELVSKGKLRLDPIITHRFSFEDAPAAYDMVRRRPEGLVKAVIVL